MYAYSIKKINRVLAIFREGLKWKKKSLVNLVNKLAAYWGCTCSNCK